MKPTSGEKACGFLAFRGLSAAPLCRLTTITAERGAWVSDKEAISSPTLASGE